MIFTPKIVAEMDSEVLPFGNLEVHQPNSNPVALRVNLNDLRALDYK